MARIGLANARAVGAMVVLGLLALVTGCGNGTSSAQAGSGSSPGATGSSSANIPNVEITVSNPTQYYGIPYLVAQNQGFFKKNGVNVTNIIPGLGGSTTLRNMVQGHLAMGEISFPDVVTATLHGEAKLLVVGGAAQSAFNLGYYALASNTKVQNIKQAHSWAYTNPGSVTQAITYLLPKAAGINPSSINRVAAGSVANGVALLNAGKVDVAVVFTATVVQNPSKYRLIGNTGKELKYFQQSVLTTTPAYAASHRNVIKGLVAGYQEAVNWIGTHEEQAAQLYASSVKTSVTAAQQVVKEAVADHAWSTAYNPQALDTAVQGLKVEKQPTNVPWCSLFSFKYLPSGEHGSLPTSCPS